MGIRYHGVEVDPSFRQRKRLRDAEQYMVFGLYRFLPKEKLGEVIAHISEIEAKAMSDTDEEIVTLKAEVKASSENEH